MPEPLPGYESECFFVAPIGKEGTDLRKRSDGVRDFIVKPAVQGLGLTVLRADDLAKPGQITLQAIEHVLRAKAVVADLTFANPNVFYELAVRHTARLPVVLIAADGEIDALPFDIQQMRVIGFDHQDLASAARARDQIAQHLSQAVAGAVDSPIATVLNLEALEQGTSVERTLAELVTRVDELSRSHTALAKSLRAKRHLLTGEIPRHPVDNQAVRLEALMTATLPAGVRWQIEDDDAEDLTRVEIREEDGLIAQIRFSRPATGLQLKEFIGLLYAIAEDMRSKTSTDRAALEDVLADDEEHG
jgi:hypothetical protein